MRKRLFVPEVIQTSATDCGPAALKALFAGFGRYLSYGRLREACQTDVDGTSIDTLEELGNALGLHVEQRMIAKDLLLPRAAGSLPAIVAVQLPDGAIHFVVAWNVCGRYVQVMDPAAGRLWVRQRQFLESVYEHEHSIPAADWTTWTETDAFQAGLRLRERRLQVAKQAWTDAAHLEASLRLGVALADHGLLRPGSAAAAFLERCHSSATSIPDEYWYAREDPACGGHVRVRGAVLLSATGRERVPADPLPPSLEAVRRERAPAVWTPVWHAVRESGVVSAGAIACGLAAAAAGVAAEALLFRGLIDLAQRFPRTGDRLLAIGLTIAFSATLLALEWAAAAGLIRYGRHLESRLRILFMRKIPRLSDRYFQSRLTSDMASRAHGLLVIRELPEFVGRTLSLAFMLIATTAGISWLYPAAAVPALVASAAAIGSPWLFRRSLIERDLRVRESSAGLSRFQLDALLGTCAIQAHVADHTLMAAQAPQLERWAAAGLRRQALLVGADAFQSAAAIGCVVWIVWTYAAAGWSSLLLVFWAMSIPALGAELGTVMWSLPVLRNTVLRFAEPLGAADRATDTARAEPGTDGGVSIAMDEVCVILAGRSVLDRITLRVDGGEHVAIVGASGSGKSSLVGLLLGWHEPSAGRVTVDGRPLAGAELLQLHNVTAWIDPQVHLFRATVFENVSFGLRGREQAAEAVERADLITALRRLPEGLQTLVGDRGAAVSAGEGQRIRIARGYARRGARLAILDEPARGLDRDERRELLADVRRQFAGATVLAITHDIADTLSFDRVVVMHDGRIAEIGAPRQLASDRSSRYAALLRAEQAVAEALWQHPRWRRLQMYDGVVEQRLEQSEWTTT